MLFVLALMLCVTASFTVPAEASGSHTIRVIIAWGPADCVHYNGAAMDNQFTLTP